MFYRDFSNSQQVAHLSDAEEEALAIHPKQNEPEDRHHGNAHHERFKAGSKYSEDLVSEMDMQVVDDEALPQMRDQVSRD